MSRWVLATRRLPGSNARSQAMVRLEDLLQLLRRAGCDVLGGTTTHGALARRLVVLDADDAAIVEVRASLPDAVHLERAIWHEPANQLRVTIEGDGQPLSDARVLAFVEKPDEKPRKVSLTADIAGYISMTLESDESVAMLIVRPWGKFWSKAVPDPRDGAVIQCASLPAGPRAWWHEVLGVDPHTPSGRGICVGVIDTGVGPHPCIAAEDAGHFKDGAPPVFPGIDEDGHGTHVAGLIAARASSDEHFSGVATEATLVCARVFDLTGQAHQGDLANALDALSGIFRADLVNMSLSAPMASRILHDAILDAADRGTLCICAAGNYGGPVRYPAALPECVAVGALGVRGWGAAASLCTLHLPSDGSLYGRDDLYLATFSCRGPELDCVAPGVGIISALPSTRGNAPFAEMDGTSMASPLVCASLAALLSADSSYAPMPRDASRTAKARVVLLQHCTSVGLGGESEGQGCPRIGA